MGFFLGLPTFFVVLVSAPGSPVASRTDPYAHVDIPLGSGHHAEPGFEAA